MASKKDAAEAPDDTTAADEPIIVEPEAFNEAPPSTVETAVEGDDGAITVLPSVKIGRAHAGTPVAQ